MKGKDNRVLLSKIKYEIKYIKTSGPIAQVSKLKNSQILFSHCCRHIHVVMYI